MSEKRRGLGKGLGALIPSAPPQGRPIDVFFADNRTAAADAAARAAEAARHEAASDVATASELPAAASTAAQSTVGNGVSATTPTVDGGVPSESTGSSDAVPSAGERSRADDSHEATHARKVPDLDTSGTAAGEPAHSRDEAGRRPGARAGESAATNGAEEPSESADNDLRAVPGAFFAEIPVDDIVANRRQPRQVFDEEELEELASSIREVGVLQPIVVRELPDGDDARYELIMGERRWRASRLAGNDAVPAIVRETGDTDLLRDALLENLHRAQLNPLEEAAAYSQLLEDFGCTHDELATRIARSRPQISNTLRLLKLPPLVQRRVAAGVLSAGHARALLGLSDAGAMERLAQRIVSEGLSVRTTEEIVALGDEPVQPEMRRRPRTGEYTRQLDDLAGRLADQLDTRVKVALGQRKGRINIEFASMEDLNRILQVLAPGDPGIPTGTPSG